MAKSWRGSELLITGTSPIDPPKHLFRPLSGGSSAAKPPSSSKLNIHISQITLALILTCSLLVPLHAGVQNIIIEKAGVTVSGLAGPLVLTGGAKPLLEGDLGAYPAAVAAKGKLGKGTLIGFGHEAFLKPKNDQAAAMKFICELAAQFPKDRPIAVDQKFESLAKLLSKNGYMVKRITNVNTIDNAPAAFVHHLRISPESMKIWQAYVEQGGTLITGMPGWGWKHINPNKSLERDWSPSAIYGKAGIHWTGSYFDIDASFTPPAPGSILNVSQALKTFDAEAPAQQRAAAGSQLQLAINTLPANNPTRKAVMERLNRTEIRWPSKKNPVGRGDTLNRLAILAAIQKERALPPEQVKANPVAADFPGAVPADARPVARDVEVDLGIPGWCATGLYAAPGATIIVKVPDDAPDYKLSVRIGSTTCNNTRKDKWTRAPQIDREWTLKPGAQKIASSFGGTIYIVVPKNTTGKERITIEGGIEQPFFKLGVDTDESWKQSRMLAAPWAELQSPLLSISIPSAFVRKLDNPTELMTWWNHVIEIQDQLSPRPGFPKRGERISMDREICLGYMHSGYPIMTHLDVAQKFIDINELNSKGDWGIYHEIGHNHQWRDWTFNGSSEVTNNIFTLYSHAKLNPDVIPRPLSQKKVETKMDEYWTPEGPEGQYQKDPIYALYMYQQVIDQFGFGPFERFFAKAAARPDNKRPKTDQEKRDCWLIDLSHETGRNLETLMTSWGVVTSDDAKKAVKDLPLFEMRGLPQK